MSTGASCLALENVLGRNLLQLHVGSSHPLSRHRAAARRVSTLVNLNSVRILPKLGDVPAFSVTQKLVAAAGLHEARPCRPRPSTSHLTRVLQSIAE